MGRFLYVKHPETEDRNGSVLAGGSEVDE